jgi:hypothetical protein
VVLCLLPGAPILKIKKSPRSGPDWDGFVHCPGKIGKWSVVIVGWERFQLTVAFHDYERMEITKPPRSEMARFRSSYKRVCFGQSDRWKVEKITLAAVHSCARESAIFLFVCILLSGCRSGHRGLNPSIEFTKVPPAREGGPTTLATIEGHVRGAHSGQQLVLYARSGQWWVQPLTNQPFTKIQPDSKWSNSTHLGKEYAALLVQPGYHPPAKMDSLPVEGGAVVVVASVMGEAAPPELIKTVHFSGYDWMVRTTDSNRGGAVTSYDSANAWTDSGGALHLRIANHSDKWTCAEVSLTRSLGYGMYRFVVHESTNLEPAAVLSMFTWDDSGQDQNHREIDVEITRWGDPLSKNAQYAIQPYYVPANVDRFMAPAGILTYSFQWEPGKVSFKTVRGSNAGDRSRAVSAHVFTSGVPTSGGELVHMNLYIFGGAASSLKNQSEVVIEKFEYLP